MFFQVSSKTSSFAPAVCRRAPCPLSISWQKGSSVWLRNDNREGEVVFKEVHVINDCSRIILAFFLRCRAPPPPHPSSCPENNGGELFQAYGGWRWWRGVLTKICSHSREQRQQKAALIKEALKKKNKDSSVDFIVCGVTLHAKSFISTPAASAQGP